MAMHVVTASIGERRPRLRIPKVVSHHIAYTAFVDRDLPPSPPWRQVRVIPEESCTNRSAKRYKVLIHKVLPEATESVWVDRHCQLICDPVTVFAQNPDADLMLCPHHRRCIYHEARAVIQRQKDDPRLIQQTVDDAREKGHPPRYGLWFGGIIFRRHNSRTNDFAELWWSLIRHGSKRDQLTLPQAIRETGVTVASVNRSKIMAIRSK